MEIEKKISFVIVGSGWRALYYVRIAKALPQVFALCTMLCRTREKAEKMAREYGIPTTVSLRECVEMAPDFVVVSVSKEAMAEVSREWIERGFPVLCETPAALETAALRKLWALRERGGKLAVAEQYTRYPVYQALLRVLESGLLGDLHLAVVSLAHEYHGASLIRAFLGEGMSPFQVTARTYSFSTAETLSRYERFTDGRLAEKKRTAAVFEFADGRTAFYDFDPEQYRSPIRRNYLNVRGARGELKDESFAYLDDRNRPVKEALRISRRKIALSGETNPNLQQVEEITYIAFREEEVYAPPFGLCGLASDETAMAQLMLDMGRYARGEKAPDYPLEWALQDAYMAILLREAAASGRPVESEPQPWQL